MRCKGILLHQLFGDPAGQVRFDAALDVDVRQLILLEFDVLAELSTVMPREGGA